MVIDRAGDRPDVWYRTECDGSAVEWVRLAGEILVSRFDAEGFDSGSAPGNIHNCPTLAQARQRWPEYADLWTAVWREYEHIDHGAERSFNQHALFFSEPY